VVRVHDVGVHEGRVYLVMELIVGATLRELQTAGNLSTSECLRLYVEAGRGLLAAHERGVVHRDFKPDNVFVGANGRAKVGDFGLAHLLGEHIGAGEGALEGENLEREALTQGSSLTGSGELLGTLGYMAPEQLCGDPIDARADQYGFCVALWEALDGERPFAGPSARALIAAMEGEPSGGERIDARLRKLLSVGLARTPEQRHASMADIVAGIEELLERPARRRRRVGYVVLGVLAVFGTVVGLISRIDNLECGLVDEVEELRSEHPPLELAAASSARTADKIVGWMARMEIDAEQTCRRDDPAGHQHIESLLRSMRSLLTLVRSGSDSNELNEHLARFERELASKASLPMTPEHYDLLAAELEPLENTWKNKGIVAWCEQIDPESESWEDFDRAELLLRCARAWSLVGPKYAPVVAMFKQARRLAEASGDDQRRLEANLGAAKTTIMRLRDYERGDELLEVASDLLHSLGVGPSDPRRLDYDELASIQARESGSYDKALRLQLGVVARQLRTGTTSELVAALVNLGHVYDKQARPGRAEFVYRLALGIDPEDPEAAVALGTLLNNRDDLDRDGLDEARSRFKAALATDNHDVEFYAMVGLLSIETRDEHSSNETIEKYCERLTEMLRAPKQFPRSPLDEELAWHAVVAAHIILGDDGPAYEDARSKLSKEARAEFDAIRAEFDTSLPEPSIDL
jgi:serine/threonine protein kinase